MDSLQPAENLNAHGPRQSLSPPVGNPFSFKMGQVFTGFGVGCGIGIGIGKPIYLEMDFGGFFKGKDGEDAPKRTDGRPCAIPMLQPVLSATRGATDIFSGVGRHANSALKKMGMKNIEAGVGCGIGIGHGFGVGLALKPGVVQRIQLALGQALVKMMMHMGAGPSLSSFQNIIPSSALSGIGVLNTASNRNVQTSVGSILDLASQTTGSTFQYSRSSESSGEPTGASYVSKVTSSERSFGSRSEKVIDKFLQNPLLKNEEDTEIGKLPGNSGSENSVLQMLLKHQQLIEDLMDENQKLRRILVEDLRIQPSKLEGSSESRMKLNYVCSDCFECRRRSRKSAR